MEYPTHEEGISILERFSTDNPLAKLTPVASANDIKACQDALPKIYVHRDIMSYIVSLVEATRKFDSVVLGVSPRGAQALMKVAKGYAAIDNRDYVMPDDVKKAAIPVLTHRIMLTSSAKIKANAARNVITEIVEQTPVPTEGSLGWSVR
jgi:MoxR-like ATPase